MKDNNNYYEIHNGIVIFTEYKWEQGFCFQEGFAALYDEDDNIYLISTGQILYKKLIIYEPHEKDNNKWIQSKISIYNNLAEEILEAIESYWENKYIKKEIERTKDQELYISNENIYFPEYETKYTCGVKLQNLYIPVKKHPGVYYHHIISNNNKCNYCKYYGDCSNYMYKTYQGIKALTVDEYKQLSNPPKIKHYKSKLVGRKVYIYNLKEWGIIKKYDGKMYHVGTLDGYFTFLYKRNEFRVPKKTR